MKLVKALNLEGLFSRIQKLLPCKDEMISSLPLMSASITDCSFCLSDRLLIINMIQQRSRLIDHKEWFCLYPSCSKIGQPTTINRIQAVMSMLCVFCLDRICSNYRFISFISCSNSVKASFCPFSPSLKLFASLSLIYLTSSNYTEMDL